MPEARPRIIRQRAAFLRTLPSGEHVRRSTNPDGAVQPHLGCSIHGSAGSDGEHHSGTSRRSRRMHCAFQLISASAPVIPFDCGSTAVRRASCQDADMTPEVLGEKLRPGCRMFAAWLPDTAPWPAPDDLEVGLSHRLAAKSQCTRSGL